MLRGDGCDPSLGKEQPQFILTQGVQICPAVSFCIWCNWQSRQKSCKEGQVINSFPVIYWKIHKPNPSMWRERRKKKKAPIDSTLYWQSGAKHWDFSLPFWERAVMKYCAVAQISFPSTFLQPRICCAQAWRIEQLWTWNKSMFLRSPSFSGLQNSSERLSGLISRQSRGRTSREEKLKSYWIPEDRLDPGFNCQKHLEGQISDCLIPSGARDINTRPSAKWMQSTAKSDAKEHFEHAWHWCEW